MPSAASARRSRKSSRSDKKVHLGSWQGSPSRLCTCPARCGKSTSGLRSSTRANNIRPGRSPNRQRNCPRCRTRSGRRSSTSYGKGRVSSMDNRSWWSIRRTSTRRSRSAAPPGSSGRSPRLRSRSPTCRHPRRRESSEYSHSDIHGRRRTYLAARGTKHPRPDG
jgi:hypothetical protein